MTRVMAADSVCRHVNRMLSRKNTTIFFTGRGGQGVLTASSITARAFFLCGYDVKKSDMKGIARRGGKVFSTLIAGEKVYDPKVIPQIADIAVILCDDTGLVFSEITNIILPTEEEIKRFNRSFNIFCLGKLSSMLALSLEHWEIAIGERFEGSVYTNNLSAFYHGRETGKIIRSQDEKVARKFF